MVDSGEEAIQACIDRGALPLLFAFLESSNDEDKLEATWCVTNIATGTHEQTRQILPAAPYLINFVAGSNTILQVRVPDDSLCFLELLWCDISCSLPLVFVSLYSLPFLPL